MPIAGKSLDYTDYPPETSQVPKTLLDLNTRLPGVLSHQRAVAVGAVNGIGISRGCKVSAGTFPVINVGAGSVTDEFGTTTLVSAGTLSVPATPDAVRYIYVADGVLALGAAVPENVVLVLAKVTVNSAGNGFENIDTKQLVETRYTDADTGELQTLVIETGGVRLVAVNYEYDEDGLPTYAHTQYRDRYLLEEFAFDDDELPVSVNETRNATPILFLDGGYMLDDEFALDGLRP